MDSRSPSPSDTGEQDREELRNTLARAGIEAVIPPISPWALMLRDGRPATGLRTPEWQRGLFEVQDAGSQVRVCAYT